MSSFSTCTWGEYEDKYRNKGYFPNDVVYITDWDAYAYHYGDGTNTNTNKPATLRSITHKNYYTVPDGLDISSVKGQLIPGLYSIKTKQNDKSEVYSLYFWDGTTWYPIAGGIGNSNMDEIKLYVHGYVAQQIDTLDKQDTEIEGQYVSSVSQENGIISVVRKTLPDATIKWIDLDGVS